MGAPLWTARLRLEPAMPDDVPALVDHFRRPAVRRHLWDDVEVDQATVRDVVAQGLADSTHPGLGLWVLRRHDETAPCGTCGLRTTDDGEVELVVSLDREVWGYGYAVEACRAVLDRAEACGVGAVVGYADPGNVASVRLLRRLGMSGGPQRWVTPTPS